MTAIKFRGRTKEGMTVYGGITPSGKEIVTEAHGKKGWYLVRVDPKSVSQYTGYVDSSGREIFDHDHVRVEFFGSRNGSQHVHSYLYEVQMFPVMHMKSVVTLDEWNVLPVGFVYGPDVKSEVVDV